MMTTLHPMRAVQTSTSLFAHGLLSGFVPLVRLSGGLLLSLAITIGVRALISSQDFAVQQMVPLLVVGLSMLVTIGAYAWSAVHAWREAKRWRQAGEVERYRGACCALAVTALLILLPFVLALAWPQSPAVAK